MHRDARPSRGYRPWTAARWRKPRGPKPELGFKQARRRSGRRRQPARALSSGSRRTAGGCSGGLGGHMRAIGEAVIAPPRAPSGSRPPGPHRGCGRSPPTVGPGDRRRTPRRARGGAHRSSSDDRSRPGNGRADRSASRYGRTVLGDRFAARELPRERGLVALGPGAIVCEGSPVPWSAEITRSHNGREQAVSSSTKPWGYSSAGRASAWHAEGPGFESP